MNIGFKTKFLDLWAKYFDGAELPFIFYYTDEEGHGKAVKKPSISHQCLIAVLNLVRNGKSLCFSADSLGCSGAERYLGFSEVEISPSFKYFLSSGTEGKLEGERYKKSPEIVEDLLKNSPKFKSPAKYIVFKRWDKLEENDEPAVVIFYAKPDILSGLFTLSGFEETSRFSVIAPFGAGCASIIEYPYLENKKENPQAVIGMFDVSARPYVPKDILSFAIPMKKFKRMVDNMDESFLITKSWEKVKKRII
ncbi:MAG: DUF169 domain-containing protein [bacterium]|nr:DUF169 domain-containing protein [bacterium]